jgi:DNA-directed RNA polymerase subunit RPC12/RpoP
MPGHIIRLRCPCGYRAEASPGASDPETILVMAHDAAAKDIVTVDAREAKRRRLRTLKDPFLRDPLSYQAKALLECPKCGKRTLAAFLGGFWD